MAIFFCEFFGLVFPGFQAPPPPQKKIHAQDSRPESSAFLSNFTFSNPIFLFTPIFCLRGETDNLVYHLAKKDGGKLFYWQLELFCLQLSFFAYSPLRPFLEALSHCKQKAPTVSNKKAKAVSKIAPTVSKKAKTVTVSKESSTVSGKPPTASKKSCILERWHTLERL